MVFNESNQFFKKGISTSEVDHVLHQNVSKEFLVYSSVPGNSSTTFLSLPESVTYTVLPSEWVDYFSGVLQNQGVTDYIAYCQVDEEGVQHYVLIYDLQLQDDEVISSEYPCLYCSDDSIEYGTTSTVVLPGIAYGSFGQYSDLREGGVNYVSFAILLALCISFFYRVVSDIFAFIHNRSK